ncbi:MAG: hypothetical protein JWQ84_3286 [Mucilaginibacter sp.]|nr:hypothetical protein [Mucilaginibacter sp.]
MVVGKDFEPEVSTIEFNQISLLKIHYIMYGTIDTGVSNYEVQLAYVATSNMLEPVLVRSNLVEFVIQYYSDISEAPNRKPYDTASIIDYKGYADTVTLMGNSPITFKEFVLKCITNKYEDELDYDLYNHTSYFNLKSTTKKEDFITAKGMQVYIEEIVKDFTKRNNHSS